jgi:hypothetical protein
MMPLAMRLQWMKSAGLDVAAGPMAQARRMLMKKTRLIVGVWGVLSLLVGSPATAAVTQIFNKTPVQVSGAAGAQKRFKIWVPSKKTQVVFTINGDPGDGDADLYVRRGAKPTTTNWDFRPFLTGNDERVIVNNPATTGTWYHVMVHAFEPISDITLLAKFQTVPRLADNGGVLKNRADDMEGGYSHFHINVPPGATKLIVKTSGGPGDADLYVNFSLPADEERWDFRSFKLGNSESVNVNNPTAGTWWAMLHAFDAYSGVKLTAEYEGLPKYRMSSQSISDTGSGVNFTKSPDKSWRYGNWGGPAWTNKRELKVGTWNGAFDASPVDALDDKFRLHDRDVHNANGSNGEILTANQTLLNRLNNLPNGANGSNHPTWGRIYLSSPAGAPAMVTVKPGSPIALPQFINQPTPMPFSEYARRQAKLGLNDGWFTE